MSISKRLQCTDTQTMGICVLFSFWVVVNYYLSLKGERSISLNDFCKLYLKHIIKNDSDVASYGERLRSDYENSEFGIKYCLIDFENDIDAFKSNNLNIDSMNTTSLQFFAASIFHIYANNNHLSGYEYVCKLNQSIEDGTFTNIKSWDDVSACIINESDKFAAIWKVLTEPNESIALFTTLQNNQFHSQVCWIYSGKLYIKDPNKKSLIEIQNEYDFRNSISEICECMLFRII